MSLPLRPLAHLLEQHAALPEAGMTHASKRKVTKLRDEALEAQLAAHQRANATVASEMSARGFMSVFEHVRPLIAGQQQVYTMWLKLASASGWPEMMTIVDERGGIGYYDLVPNFRIKKEKGNEHGR